MSCIHSHHRKGSFLSSQESTPCSHAGTLAQLTLAAYIHTCQDCRVDKAALIASVGSQEQKGHPKRGDDFPPTPTKELARQGSTKPLMFHTLNVKYCRFGLGTERRSLNSNTQILKYLNTQIGRWYHKDHSNRV
jgi:hypothetical protein